MVYNVIDADGHILEPPDLWEQYIEPKFREGYPKLITAADGLEIFRVEHDDAIDLGRGKTELLRRHAPRSNRLPHLPRDLMGLVVTQFEIAGDFERQLQ